MPGLPTIGPIGRLIVCALVFASGSRAWSDPLIIVSTDPPDEAIDAGETEDGLRARWSSVSLSFNSDASAVAASDFSIEASDGAAPLIVGFAPNGNAGILSLDRPISVGVWTTITYVPTEASFRLGHLPGDINGDGYAGPRDAIALIDALNGVIPPLPTWATDVDRSGAFDADDTAALQLILAGNETEPPWNGHDLPENPAPPDPPGLVDPKVEIELIPSQPAPYSPGSHVNVDVRISNLTGQDVYLRFAQLDTTDTDPALAFGNPEFEFDYSALTDAGLYIEFPAYPYPSTVYFGTNAMPGFILSLPGYQHIHLGTIRDQIMPPTSGSFTLDVMNATASDPNFGAQLQFGFGVQPDDPVTAWRAFTGELVGGTFAFVVTECTTDSECDDANPCTDDTCVDGVCTSAPDDLNDPNDGLFCNGIEQSCLGGVVIYSSPPPDCEDNQACTVDSCNEQSDDCDYEVASGFCLIDGACWADGELNPSGECEQCSYSRDPLAWSPSPTGTDCGAPGGIDCCNGAGNCDSDLCGVDPCAWSFKSNDGPPPQAGRPMVFDSARGVIVLFGRYCETWERDGLTWTLRSTTGPSPRSGHGLAYDSARGVTVLFGGLRTGPPILALRDTWEWDGSTWTLRGTTGPTYRSALAMAYDSGRSVTVLYGGFGSGEYLGDTWEWNGATWVERSNTGPSPREHHAMAYDAARGVTVMFGGDPSGETWEWDGTNWLFRTAGGPQRWRESQLVYDDTRQTVVMFGGAPSSAAAGTWEWNGTIWGLRTVAEPPPRTGHAMAIDGIRGVTVVFAGRSPEAVALSDTWEFGGPCAPMEVCCLTSPAPECVLAEPAVCATIGATPLGPGAVCQGDTNGDGVDQSCEGDCDGDGILDGDEVYVTQQDCNLDGICNGIEIATCPPTNPFCVDSNDNGLPDECEVLHRIFIQAAGTSPLGVPQEGVTVQAKGGEIITLDLYVEKTPPDQRIQSVQVTMPCTVDADVAGVMTRLGDQVVDTHRPDYLSADGAYCDAGTNIGLPCVTSADCPGSPPRRALRHRSSGPRA